MKKLIFTLIVFAFFANVQAQLEVDAAGDARVYKDIYIGSSSNFLGTTGDNVPVAFRVNSTLAGFTGSTWYYNVSFGYGALSNSLTGYDNTAIGFKALYANTTGGNNVATGCSALFSNTTGNNNTATGYQALLFNNTGSSNTANGYQALYANTAGYWNTATGTQALYNNTTGTENIANGYRALYNNTGGCENAATGSFALYNNTTGHYNTAGGMQALYNNTTGSFNTACGYQALVFNTTSSLNTAIGAFAGGNNIGNQTNTTTIGYSATATASNQVRIGNSNVTSIGGYTSWSNISDRRAKKNIRTNVPGLDFINRLQSVMYNFNLNGVDELLKSDDPKINEFRDSLLMARSPEEIEIEAKARADKEKIVYSGFIAQDVESAAKSIGYDFSGVDVDELGIYGLRYSEFVVPLVKAVQELSEQNNRLQEQNNRLQEQNDRQQEQINELTELVYRLTGKEDAPPILKSGTGDASGIGLPESPADGASLEQNVPNPFSVNTEIRFFLPGNIKHAYICIFDIQGTMLKKTNNLVGQSTLIIQGSELKAGMYLYSLIADGKEVDTKRMILTQ